MHGHLLILITVGTALLPLPGTASSLPAGNSLQLQPNLQLRLVNVSYPFTSGDSPAHYRPLEFRLSCDGYYPVLTADSLIYHVRAHDQTCRSLTFSRTDLDSGDTCLRHYANTTLNSTIFTFASDNEGLTLFYECSNSTNTNPDNLFSCETNGTDADNYYMIGAVPTDPILNGSKCNVNVTVPILPSGAIMLTAERSLLSVALMEGFDVNCTNPYEDQCVMRGGIGGECRLDFDQGKPICICGDQICPTSAAGSTRMRKFIIGGAFAVGASISAITIIFHMEGSTLQE